MGGSVCPLSLLPGQSGCEKEGTAHTSNRRSAALSPFPGRKLPFPSACLRGGAERTFEVRREAGAGEAGHDRQRDVPLGPDGHGRDNCDGPQGAVCGSGEREDA